ncbi:MAG: type II toxin-antitoxin system RelE/ParE family toxin [Alphaproteobacteria bacterium]
MDIVWTASALADVQRIRSYISDFRPRAAEDMGVRLIEAGNDLALFPHRGRLVSQNLRELTLVYPYIIRYSVVANQVFILRVRHGKQQS